VIRATRYHDISCGHRVFGHESKCAHLHGHNYRVHFTVEAVKLDSVGRVLDFSVIKSRLCMWLEDNWDHRFLLWTEDDLLPYLRSADPDGVVAVPFNPTAERMAEYLVTVIGPRQLQGTGCQLVACRIEETRKCAAEFLLPSPT
jgi:6-pyruvoyltetrahydropterin/6-carboxytetrahydropterin synthase